jgi:AcrR family transcriptional regulator
MAARPVPEEPDRPRLSKSAVVGGALKLADSVGLDALTMRRLAADLGVTTMALYWHYRSKDELLAAMADQIWSEIDVEVDTSAPWPEQLRALMESLVGVLRAHPSAPQLVLGHEKQSEAALNAIEITLELLRGAGFDPRESSEIARSVLWNGLMLVMSEPGRGPEMKPGLTDEERAEKMRQTQVLFAMLPVARYPRLVECAQPLAAADDPEFHYRFGIDLFIAAVRAMAPGEG